MLLNVICKPRALVRDQYNQAQSSTIEVQVCAHEGHVAHFQVCNDIAAGTFPAWLSQVVDNRADEQLKCHRLPVSLFRSLI